MAKHLKVIIGIVVVLAVAAGGFVAWFLRDDAPDAVDLQAAVDGLDGDRPGDTTDDGATGTTGGTDGTGSTDDIDGTWAVDRETGSFGYESATGTFAGFRVQEELAGIGSTTAVGRTPAVTGTMVIEGTTLTAVEIEVDLTELTTNESRRDRRVQEALETDRFPTATFRLTGAVDLRAEAASGGPVSVTATGDLTVHGVTRSIEIPIDAQVVDGTTVVAVGSVDLTFSDYGVEVPSAPIVLSADDHGVLELQLLFTRA